ncbi:THO complex subunit 4A [Sesamum indicum]|uniref:THO complex subunit 4A n=1 Tax=Sesamum indicum TaxID=4182 RepID=A0A6I9UAP6_SESIN|nr:THO complex subunit 4A [Sesamum indicum]
MSNLDMTLDDMIKMNKPYRAGHRTSVQGPTRRFQNRFASRAAPYSFANAQETHLDQGMFAAGAAFPSGGGDKDPAIEIGTKLLISNLHCGVSDDDIKEIFLCVGDLMGCSVHYDRSGRSKGTAEVVFIRSQDAETAIKRYNNVQLDGKPMRIEIVGMNRALPPPLLPASHGRNARLQRRSNTRRPPPGAASGMRKDHWGGRGRGEKISAEDLDADLEKYLAEAKETS